MTIPKAPPKWRQDAINDIIDKQYRLYSWNDQKANSLITANSLLFATIGFIFKDTMYIGVSRFLMSTAIIFLLASLLLSLVQVVPQRSSKKSGDPTNIRSMRGILSNKNWIAYKTSLTTITPFEYFDDCARQIYGMTINNERSRKMTTLGVFLTAFASIEIVGSVLIVAYSSKPAPIVQAETLHKAVVSVPTEKPVAAAGKLPGPPARANLKP